MSDLPDQTSPLDEADAKSLEELFNKDPLHLTEQDLHQTVLYFRKARETFLKQDAAKVPRGAKNNPNPVKKVDLDAKLTIDDLELDL